MVPDSCDKLVVSCDKRRMLIDGFYMPTSHFTPKMPDCLYKVLAQMVAVTFLSTIGTSPSATS